MSQNIKNDLEFLGIDYSKLDTLTVSEARKAYHRVAKQIHPDKTDQENLEKVAKNNAAFQKAGNCYERIIKFIIDKLKTQKEENHIQPSNDEELFAKENFEKFNFLCQNKGSFTVNVEDSLAEIWQECLESFYGTPRVDKNEHGTECDRIWKVKFGLHDNKIELTIHFYNHNKPKDKKQSKILIQGSLQSVLYDFVFGELPKVYKMVNSKRICLVTPPRKQKRRRISTTINKRNMRYKPAQKLQEIKCTFCEFLSLSNVKMIRHMKTEHTETQPKYVQMTPRVLAEDLSLCELGDDAPENVEKLLSEYKHCDFCEFEAQDDQLIEEHIHEAHIDETATIKENVKPPPLYKCNSCVYTALTTSELQAHIIEGKEENQVVYLHSCISCPYKTNDYNDLNIHINSNHRPKTVIKCKFCSYEFKTTDQLDAHLVSEHEDRILKKCEFCELQAQTEEMEEHMKLVHSTTTVSINICPEQSKPIAMEKQTRKTA